MVVLKKDNKSIKQLLQKVEEVYQYPIVHTKDCVNLAYAISAKTNERISGSTIKRLYGFVKSTSAPSNFTLNLLAKYIDFDGFKSFSETLAPQPIVSAFKTITNNYIATIKHHSGLTTNSWIKNIEGINQLENFIQSNKSITAVIGEGGSGKSILLTQFAELYLQKKKKVLFLSSNYLNKTKGNQTLNEWLVVDKAEILIIDAIEETAYNFTDLRLFFIELVAFLASKPKNLKVIISIRPFSWIKLTEFILKTQSEKQWFNVNFNLQNTLQVSNIPLLTTKNLLQLLPSNFNESLLSFLRIPLFFQIYKQAENKAILNDWDLLAVFFKQKVWGTAYAFEKSLFFEAILKGTMYGVKGSVVNRKAIEELIVRYKKAHLELLTFKVLGEEKSVNKFGTFTSSYRFGHEIYFDFIILTHLIEQHNGYSQALVQYINVNYDGERKLSLLKLAVSYALKNLDAQIATFFELDLGEYEYQTVMFHLVNQIRTNKEFQQKILPLFIHQKSGRKYFIERWIDEENLNGFYGEILKEYLTVVSAPQDILFANSLLYYNAYLQNDESACKKYIKVILNTDIFSNYIHPFVLGRRCMSLMLEEYRLTKTYSKQLLIEITNFLEEHLKESAVDFPVHFSGFEHNILHAEFLTKKYIFTPQILKRFDTLKKELLHSKSHDLMLLEIFTLAYVNDKSVLSFNEEDINGLHPWLRKTIRDYILRLKQQ